MVAWWTEHQTPLLLSKRPVHTKNRIQSQCTFKGRGSGPHGLSGGAASQPAGLLQKVKQQPSVSAAGSTVGCPPKQPPTIDAACRSTRTTSTILYFYEWGVIRLGCDGKEHQGEVEGSWWSKCVNGCEVVTSAVAMCQSVALKIRKKSVKAPADSPPTLFISRLWKGLPWIEHFIPGILFPWNRVNLHCAGMCSHMCASKSVS